MVLKYDRAVKAIRKFQDALDRIVAEELRNTGREIQDQVIADKSFKGNKLRHSIRYRNISKSTIRVGSKSPHASFVEHGTRPHVITPRRKRWLYFQTATGPRFAKRVNHPGTKATRFFSRAVDRSFASMQRRLRNRVRAAAKKF